MQSVSYLEQTIHIVVLFNTCLNFLNSPATRTYNIIPIIWLTGTKLPVTTQMKAQLIFSTCGTEGGEGGGGEG